MSITSHVLDTFRGRPAAGIRITLEMLEGNSWRTLAEAATDANGRAANLVPSGTPLAAGSYRLAFAVASYFQSLGVEPFYREIVVAFEVGNPAEHYHVPLLLSPFGYTTYRGS